MRPCALLLVALAGAVYASSGDRSPEFHGCVSRCRQRQCTPPNVIPLSLPLRLTHWTCEDNCNYSCMHDITSRDKRLGDRVHQYFGKWPFWRLFGIQEPASVAFSLLNFWAHWRGLERVRREIPDGHPMKEYYIVWAFTGLNAWIWSAVFHTRDWPITEKLDYFSAALTIFYALYYTVVRLFHLYPSSRRTRLTLANSSPGANNGGPTLRIWSLLCILVYLCHVSYLTLLPRFDYFYNIVFNAVVGLTHNALWALYALPASVSVFRRFPGRPKAYRPAFVTKTGVIVACMTAASALELFDFAPLLRVIDAHSLWHLATAPIAVAWYTFLIQDAREDSWRAYLG
ncbi:Post-GPI attachment to proteins factor 3 [Mycena chlorophos]|uniref:Post-GPI attachment to proteins factor 3 n=1 Tax=Mycena chlorophos TaxID=658473 RepID=A0A8H6S524_MYCCL|nr:Post-GPI attachment to proteins factor 3 [Mycena chlorophos]